jgi:rhamnogalacturonan endolyase
LSDAEVWLLACEESFIVADREFPPWRRAELLYEQRFGRQALEDNWVCNGEPPIVTDDAFVFTHMSVNICRERFEGPIAVDCVVEPMPTEKYSAGVTDLICIWMIDGPEGDLFEYMRTLDDASLNNYMPLPFYWVDFGGTNNKTTRLRKNPYRHMVRQFNDRARLLRRDATYRITMVQNADVIEFWVDGQCWIQRHDPHPLTVGYVGFRAFVADVKLSELKVWRIDQ